ncbi:MAG: hypothetical protein ACLUD2_09440 [Clostridium sp.]
MRTSASKAPAWFSRSSAYNFINVCTKYSVHDDDGFPTKLLKKEYAKSSSSQLIAMLRLNDEAITQIDPSAAIKEIKQIGKAQTQKLTVLDDSEEEEAAEDGEERKREEKKNVRDTNIPVMRLAYGKSGLTWDSRYSDAKGQEM